MQSRDNALNLELIKYASCGHLPALQGCLQQEADANFECNETTALGYAILGGQMHVAIWMLENIDHLNLIDALACAAAIGNLTILKLILSKKPNLNQGRGSDAVTPLYCAAQNGNEEAVKLLLSHRADPTIPAANGETPLFVAASFNKHASVSILIKALAAITTESNCAAVIADIQKSENKKNPTLMPAYLEALSNRGNELSLPLKASIINLLSKCEVKSHISKYLEQFQSDLQQSDTFHNRLLLKAAAGGQFVAVRALVSKGAVLDFAGTVQEGKVKADALYWAVTSKRYDLVEWIMRQVNNCNRSSMTESGAGLTPLGIAAELGLFDIAKLLLLHKADPDTKTELGETPLICAIVKGHIILAELLLEHGANPAIAMKPNGETALYFAARHGHEKLVSLLIERLAALTNMANFASNILKAELMIKDRDMRKEYLAELKKLYFLFPVELQSAITQQIQKYDEEMQALKNKREMELVKTLESSVMDACKEGDVHKVCADLMELDALSSLSAERIVRIFSCAAQNRQFQLIPVLIPVLAAKTTQLTLDSIIVGIIGAQNFCQTPLLAHYVFALAQGVDQLESELIDKIIKIIQGLSSNQITAIQQVCIQSIVDVQDSGKQRQICQQIVNNEHGLLGQIVRIKAKSTFPLTSGKDSGMLTQIEQMLQTNGRQDAVQVASLRLSVSRHTVFASAAQSLIPPPSYASVRASSPHVTQEEAARLPPPPSYVGSLPPPPPYSRVGIYPVLPTTQSSILGLYGSRKGAPSQDARRLLDRVPAHAFQGMKK